jgi:hypothetical protein
MYDAVRWTILVLLFAGLTGAWLWSRRQVAGRGAPGKELGPQFRILQKRWIDQKTGICLVEADQHQYLLAYTVGGSVSWQPLEKQTEPKFPEPATAEPKLDARRNGSPKATRQPSRAKILPVPRIEPEHISR